MTSHTNQDPQSLSGLGAHLGLKTILVYVGPHRQPFCVHKSLLCSRVAHFDALLNGGLEESQKRAVALPDDDPAAFSLFLEWLYTARLSSVVSEAQFVDRIKLYGFAARIDEHALMTVTMVSILDGYRAMGEYPSVEAVRLVYELTAPRDRLRFFMADVLYHVIGLRNEPLAEVIGAVLGSPADLAADLVELMRSGEPAQTPATLIALHLPDCEE